MVMVPCVIYDETHRKFDPQRSLTTKTDGLSIVPKSRRSGAESTHRGAPLFHPNRAVVSRLGELAKRQPDAEVARVLKRVKVTEKPQEGRRDSWVSVLTIEEEASPPESAGGGGVCDSHVWEEREWAVIPETVAPVEGLGKDWGACVVGNGKEFVWCNMDGTTGVEAMRFNDQDGSKFDMVGDQLVGAVVSDDSARFWTCSVISNQFQYHSWSRSREATHTWRRGFTKRLRTVKYPRGTKFYYDIDGKRALYASGQELWLSSGGTNEGFAVDHGHCIRDFATCWRENKVVVCHGLRTVTLADIGEMKEVWRGEATCGCVGGVAIDESAQLMVAGSVLGCVDIWDVRQGGTPCKSFGASLRCPELALHPDGQQVVTLDTIGGERLSLWDLRRCHGAVWTTDHGGSQRMEANFQTKRMVSLDRRAGVVKAWDLSTGEKVGQVESGVGHAYATMFSWSKAQSV